MNEGYRILSELLAGLLLFGGLGWLIDHFSHTVVALPIGLVVGMALATYTVYLRHEKGDRPLFSGGEGTKDRAEKGETQ